MYTAADREPAARQPGATRSGPAVQEFGGDFVLRRATKPPRDSIRLLERLLPELDEVTPLVAPLLEARRSAEDQRRAVVERYASALWGMFSHHRAVIEAATGQHYHLGTWRGAAELIAELANRRYAGLNLPIRYMDCYVGALGCDEPADALRALHVWLFTRLRDCGCDWVWSLHALAGEPARRDQLREAAAAMSLAYHWRGSIYQPLPPVAAAYREVYGRLPDGWPNA